MEHEVTDPTLDGERLHVLVVDDDQVLAETIAESLERVGFETTIATGGAEGARKVEQQDFDVILTDLKMAEVIENLKKYAPMSITVLINGETGTGKELVAKAIHTNSPRKNKPFVAMNCTALNENLLEDELFGHEPGSFTGADRMRKGRFEHANGGTLFLDEVGDMPT